MPNETNIDSKSTDSLWRIVKIIGRTLKIAIREYLQKAQHVKLNSWTKDFSAQIYWFGHSEHHRSFYKLVDNKEYDQNSDGYALWHYLSSDHNSTYWDDFNSSYSIFAST